MLFNVTAFEKLVWLWFPCALGAIDLIGGAPQQFLSFLCYLGAIILWLDSYKSSKINPLVIFWLSSVFVSIVTSNTGFLQYIQFFALIGAVAWSLLIIRLFSLSDFIFLLSKISKFYVIISVIYILIMPSHSYGYVNNELAFSSFFEQKNTYGRFLFLGFFFHLLHSFWNTGSRGFFSFTFVFWLLVFIVLLALSASKSSIVLSVLAALVLTSMTILSNTVIIKRILIAVLMGLVVVSPLIVFGFVFEYKGVGTALDCMQITNNFCMSGTGRFTIWNTVIEDTLTDNYLLFGYGYSVYFNDLAEVYLSNIGLGGFIPNDPHNGFIDIFSAMGVFGVLLYTSILLMSIAGLWRLNENEFVFFSVFLFVYVVSNFTESYFLKSTNIYPVLFYFYLNYYWKQRL